MDCESTAEVAPAPAVSGFWWGPERDYPPSTCYVRVVWLGSVVFGSATGAGVGRQRFGRGCGLVWVGGFGGQGQGQSEVQRRCQRRGEAMGAGGAGVIVAGSGLWGGR